jgi:DNA replication and repair protein RecF
LFLQELQLQQFRCFADKKLYFSAPITLITGNNGVGKTSIVEAIYYLSYFKSFRSHVISDLMYAGTDSFFLKGEFSIEKLAEQHSIQVGYSAKRKSIKFDQKQVTSHKEILSLFQVVTLTEDDVDLIKGYPAGRRAFIDQAVLLAHPETLEIYREFKQVLQHRNALLERYYQGCDKLEFEIWTQKLIDITVKIQTLRQNMMIQVETMVNQLIEQFFDGIYEVSLSYDSKVATLGDSEAVLRARIDQLIHQERALKRSMFGAHLDDLIFQIRGKKARVFASRGQQKLISLLCKLSLILTERPDRVRPLLLIDDFISDFDKMRLENLVNFLVSCQNQIIITAPFFDSNLKELLDKAHPDVLSLDV